MHSACNVVKKEFVCNSLFSIPLVEAMITYLKDKVGVVDFANAQRVVKFQSPRALRALGR